ncbi:MAG: BlaI/MecI/CopY family transcriptional regulator [Bacteroidota bacterium]
MAKPTDSELGILSILWAEGPQTVRSINDRLNLSSTKHIGYTTTLKFLQLMLEKGLVSCDKSSRTHIYTAAAEEEKVRQGLVSRIVDQAFRGSAAQLVLQALGQSETSADELAAIKALIEQKEREQS